MNDEVDFTVAFKPATNESERQEVAKQLLDWFCVNVSSEVSLYACFLEQSIGYAAYSCSPESFRMLFPLHPIHFQQAFKFGSEFVNGKWFLNGTRESLDLPKSLPLELGKQIKEISYGCIAGKEEAVFGAMFRRIELKEEVEFKDFYEVLRLMTMALDVEAFQLYPVDEREGSVLAVAPEESWKKVFNLTPGTVFDYYIIPADLKEHVNFILFWE